MENKRLPINGYEGRYEVDDQGNVYSVKRWCGYYTVNEKKLKPEKGKFGYLRVNLPKDGKVKKFLVHRLVAEAFIPNPLNKETVNHKNSIRDDNRVENLEWATHKENMLHAAAEGNVNYYRRSPSVSRRFEIYEHFIPNSSTHGVVQTAEKFGIGRTTISGIVDEFSEIFNLLMTRGVDISGKKYFLKQEDVE